MTLMEFLENLAGENGGAGLVITKGSIHLNVNSKGVQVVQPERPKQKLSSNPSVA